MSKLVEGTSISSPLLIITLGMAMLTLCIGNLMSWINLKNLRRNKKTNQVNASRYFDLIKVESICLMSLILSFKAWDYISINYLGTPKQNRVVKRRNRTLLDMVKSMMSFFNTLYIILGICLKYYQISFDLVPSKSVPLTLIEIWMETQFTLYSLMRVSNTCAKVKGRQVGTKIKSLLVC